MVGFKIPYLIPLLCLIFEPARMENGTTSEDNVSSTTKKAFSLDDVISGNFTVQKFNGSWISGTEFVYQVNDSLIKFDVTSKIHTTLMEGSKFEGYRISLSPNKEYALLSNSSLLEMSPFSTTCSIYCLKNGSVEPLADGQILSMVSWAPEGSALLYVLNNDIYYHQLSNETTKTRRLTFDDQKKVIYNGITDVIAEENDIADGGNTFFSPDARYLAFVTMDNTNAPESVIVKYGKPQNTPNHYPREQRYRYPKPGTTRTQYSVNLVDLADNGSSLVNLMPPVDILGENPIISVLQWRDNKTVVATWTNRVQNVSQLVSYDPSGTPQLLLKQEVSNGWLLYDLEVPFFHLDYGLLIAPKPIGNDSLGSFSHLLRYQIVNGTMMDQELDLTPGGYWVHELLELNDDRGIVYYLASPPNEPTQKHLYQVKYDDPKPRCLSCDLETPEGNLCKYVGDVSFSDDLSHYVLTCSGPDLTTIRIYNSNATEVFEWSRFDEIRQMLSERILPQRMDLTIESHGFDCRVRLLLPANFDPESKYPLLVNVYAGPESQQIKDDFLVDFQFYLSTKKQVIYAWIDGRGSSSRGTAMMYEVYRNLGVAEIEDQIEVVRKLKDQYKWIDADRIGIWGWSYGGYATAMVLTGDDDNIFKCGISVAPVTSWLDYGSIYTERYMGFPTPEDNLERYRSSSVLERIGNFQGKKFMLIHGTGDNVVHVEHSMALAKGLADAYYLYDQVIYPDEDHSLWGVWGHLYYTMDKFWSECFEYPKEEMS